MAKINRYTRLTPAQYNPLTLDEIMMVPLIKRKQHDDLLNGIAQTREGLAQVNPLDIHSPLVVAEQERLERMLQQQADEAAQNGISGKLRGDFINLNAAYQKAMGPEGVLGKADAIRAKYEKDRADILANAVKLNHNPSETMKRLDEWYANYAANHDGETLEELNLPLPPNYRRLQDLLTEVKPLMGSTIRTNRGDETYDIITDPKTGGLVFKTQSGQIITKSNDAQLNYAKQLLEQELNGEWGASNEWNGISKDQAIRQLNAGIEMMRTTETQDTRQNEYKMLTDLDDKANAMNNGTGVEKWQSNLFIQRTGMDGGNPLLNAYTSRPEFNVMTNSFGLVGNVFRDERPNPGGNYSTDGKHEIDGYTLEQMFFDPNFRTKGPKGRGIYNEADGEFLYINPGTIEGQLVIEGTYKGEKYAMTIQDKGVRNLYNKYATTKEGKDAYDRSIRRKQQYMDEMRLANPEMSNMTDLDLARAYEAVVNENLVYQQTAWSPLNPNNTYYESTNRTILGVPGSGNLGSILNSKVRIFREDGSDIISLNGRDGIDYLSNAIADNEFDDLNEEEKAMVMDRIQRAHNHGISIGDHEFANEVNYSLTDKNGATIILKVENNQQLSGKDGTLMGVDDASQLQSYLVRGVPFVTSEGEEAYDEETGNTVRINKYFAHIPVNGPNGFTIKPVVVRAAGIKFKSLSDITRTIDPNTLEVPESLRHYIKVETVADVNARVSAEIARYYNSTPGDGITNKEAQENNGY